MIPGICDSVAPLTDEEQTLYKKIEFDLEEYCQDVGVKQLLHGTKAGNSSPLIVPHKHFLFLLFMITCPFLSP